MVYVYLQLQISKSELLSANTSNQMITNIFHYYTTLLKMSKKLAESVEMYSDNLSGGNAIFGKLGILGFHVTSNI